MKQRHFSHRFHVFAGLLSLVICGATLSAAWALCGKIIEFPMTTAGSGPFGITAGPDGNLWFTEQFGNKIGRITPKGNFKEFSVPTASSVPLGITAGPDGNLWFTESQTNQIGQITTAGKITEFLIPTAGSGVFLGLTGITAGPDGNLCFTESSGNKIGQITTAGASPNSPLRRRSAAACLSASRRGPMASRLPSSSRSNQWRMLQGLCRKCARSDALGRRHHFDRQSRLAQELQNQESDRG